MMFFFRWIILSKDRGRSFEEDVVECYKWKKKKRLKNKLIYKKIEKKNEKLFNDTSK